MSQENMLRLAADCSVAEELLPVAIEAIENGDLSEESALEVLASFIRITVEAE